MGLNKEEPHTNTKTSPSLLSITPALEARKKTQQTSKSADLQLTYLQQFKRYPLPLIPLPKTASQLCRLPQPLQLKYNPVLFLEEQVCQEEAEEAHQEEVVEVHQEEEMPTNQPKEMENPWAHYQQSSKEIA